MFNTNRNRFIRNSLLAVITLFTAIACSSSNPVKQENNLSIERVSSDKATIRHAYFQQTGDQLSLRGEVKRRGTGRGPIPGHLHISLINPEGEKIKEADIRYMRRSVKSSIASFSTKLPSDLEKGSTIRITHFRTKTHHTQHPEEGVWRDVQSLN